LSLKFYFCAMIQKGLFSFIFILVLAAGVSTSCSKYNKLLKSQDVELKYTKAVEYYEKDDFQRALPLFEELIALNRGTARSETIYYYFAKCHFGLRDYYLASFYFDTFTKTYPNSKYTEECAYMTAYSHYLNSPLFSLDQEDTHRAIKQFQLFLERYPNTSLRDTSNILVEKLLYKLEEKAYESAALYYDIHQYKAAAVALNNVLKDFPNSRHKEDILFLILESNYLLAARSVESKKEERLRETIKSYHNFVDSFANSKKLKQAEGIYDNVLRELERINL